MNLMTINPATAVVAIVLMIGAGICVRDAVELYREAKEDGIYKLPLGAAFSLTLVAVVLLIVF